MSRKKSQKKKKRRPVGVEAVIEPGVGALYVRGTWIKKLNELGKNKRKLKMSRVKRKH
jgi:hypothetical protein